MRRRHLALLLVALAALAAGAALLWRTRAASPVARLAAAVGPHVDFDARLSGGFQPPAPTDVRRAGSATPRRLPPEARVEIGRIEGLATTEQRGAVVRALGAAHLLQGEVDLAIATFEEAIARTDGAPEWNDLSAAFLVKAERTPARRIEYVAHALEAASRSLARAASPEARFNRALALDTLAPYVGSTDGWRDYLAIERDGAWREVATRRSANPPHTADPRSSWDERRQELSARAARGDRAFVVETAQLFPERVIDRLDRDVLVDWARARTSGDRRTAMAALREAAILADAFAAATHDPMPADAVALMNTAAGHELARAHLAYAESLTAFDAGDYRGAMQAIDTAIAGFERARSPYWGWAALRKAVVFYHQQQFDRSHDLLEAVEVFARRHGYETLVGRTLRQRGLTESKRWRVADALDAWQQAIRRFEAANEREDAVTVQNLVANTLRYLGEHEDGWEYVGRTLEGLGRVQPAQRYLFLFSASLFALRQELYDAARLFQDAAVREARSIGDARVIEALAHRALVRLEYGDSAGALQDLDEARGALDTVADADLKRGLTAEVDILIAELSRTTHRLPPIDGLARALRFFSAGEPSLAPRVYLGLARAQLAAGAHDAAAQAFVDGIAELESQQARLDNEAFKISYFDESWSLYPELIAFLVDVRRDPDRAFAYAERSRARSLLASTEPIGVRALQALVPDSFALVYYVTLSDRLLTWTITREAADLTTTRIGRDELARLVGRYRLPLSEGWAEDGASGAALYDALIAPIASRVASKSTLVVLPDGDLQRLPFATLRAPRSGRFLIEDHALLVAPSASFFAARSSARREPSARIASALLVGNPASGTDASLPALPGAEAEVAAAAQFYPTNHVLVGGAATKPAFLRLAPESDVVHFGGHAVMNAEYPLLSRLPFAPARDGEPPQPLFAHEISRLRFDRTRLVVLAACSTAAGVVSRGEGVMSLARPFLAAGVPTVVAAQWDVSDRDTEPLLLAFHRALSTTQDPVKALQIAQLALLRGRNASLARPRSWGAFVALGRSSD